MDGISNTVGAFVGTNFRNNTTLVAQFSGQIRHGFLGCEVQRSRITSGISQFAADELAHRGATVVASPQQSALSDDEIPQELRDIVGQVRDVVPLMWDRQFFRSIQPKMRLSRILPSAVACVGLASRAHRNQVAFYRRDCYSHACRAFLKIPSWLSKQNGLAPGWKERCHRQNVTSKNLECLVTLSSLTAFDIGCMKQPKTSRRLRTRILQI